MIGELEIHSKTLGLGCGALQAPQQPLCISRVTDHHRPHRPDIHYSQMHLRGNEITAQKNFHGRRTPQQCVDQQESEHVQMQIPSDGIAKTMQEQKQALHGSDLSQHHRQGKVTQRPLPKHLLPVISTSGTVTVPSSIGMSMPMEASIELTDLESKIFDLLKDFLLFYKFETKIRVAGGWVRDKLLRRHSEDIDIALDNMRGKTFCKKLCSYCHKIGLEQHGFGVLKSKPTQARHLEVVKMVILKVAIDFVNLRPTECSLALQDIGTPEEDAYSRDFTINSLFYNVNTGMVEDPTGRGLSDLKAGIIATSSHAKSTFMDDPLRTLRALRFVSALCFKLHPAVKDAIDSDVKLALGAKISRERIGGEVDKIFRCIHPLKAMQLLVDTQLFPIVFGPPSEVKFVPPQGSERACLHALESTIEVVNYFGSSKFLDRKILYLAAFLSPLRNYTYEHKDKQVPITTTIIKESLRLRSADASMVEDTSSSEVWTSHHGMKQELGRLLRKARGLWRAALLLGTVLEEPSNGQRAEELRLKANFCIALEKEIMKLGLDETTYRIPVSEKSRMPEKG